MTVDKKRWIAAKPGTRCNELQEVGKLQRDGSTKYLLIELCISDSRLESVYTWEIVEWVEV